MLIEEHKIENRDQWLNLRKQDVTASVAGALLGISEYMTPYQLYALKSGLIQEDPEETPPMRRGRLLEPVAIQMLQEDNKSWTVTRGDTYYREPESRLGATPDAFAIDPSREGFGIVQIKTVEQSIFRRKWLNVETGEIEPPLWICVQALIEAELTGAKWAVVAPLTVGFGVDLPIIEVPFIPGLMAKIRIEITEFWQRVKEGRPYEPDYARDGEVISGIYAEDNGLEIDLSQDNRLPEILVQRAALKAREADGAAANKDRREIDNEIIAKLGHAARGRLSDGMVIEAKTIRRKSYVVDPSSYRTVKIKESNNAGSSKRTNRTQSAPNADHFGSAF